MKKNLLIAQCLALIFGLSLAACCPFKYDDFSSFEDTGVLFTIVNRGTNESLVDSRKGPFSPDFISITDSNGVEYAKDRKFIWSDGRFSIRFVDIEPAGQYKLNTTIVKETLIKFPSITADKNAGVVEKVRCEYILEEFKCDGIQLTSLKVFFNDSLYHDGKVPSTKLIFLK